MTLRTLHATPRDEKERLLPPDEPSRTKEILDKHFPEDKEEELAHDPWTARFTSFMGGVIVLNCMSVGAACQWPELQLGSTDIYLPLDTFFAVAYSIEVIIKWKHYGIKRYFWDRTVDWWNVTDFGLTVAAVTDVAARVLFPHPLPKHVMKPMSLLRIARIVRFLRLLKGIPSLTVTIGGLWGSLSTLCWVVFALFLVIYVFALFFVITARHCEPSAGDDCTDSYRDLFAAMQTLTDVVVLNRWTETIPESQPHLFAPFYLFVLLSTFGIVNVIVGVMVDATMSTRNKLEWAVKRDHLMTLGRRWEQEIHSKGLSRHALEHMNEAERAAKHSQRRSAVKEIINGIIDSGEVGFPPGTEAEEVRMLLDREGDGRVSHEEFTLGFGRILLADDFQQSIMSFINQGIIKRHVTENSDGIGRIEQQIRDMGREMSGRMDRIEQQVAEMREQMPSKKKR